MFKMLSKLGKYWWLVALMVLTTSINVLADCALPAYLGDIISSLQKGDPLSTIGITAAGMIAVAFVSGASSIATARIASKVSAKIVAQARYDLFKRVSEFSSFEMNHFSVSSLLSRTTADLTYVGNTFNLLFKYILYGPFIALLAVGLLLGSGKEVFLLAYYVLGALLLMILLIIIVIAISIKKYKAIQSKLDKITLITRENLEGLRVVRAYNAENYQEEKFKKHNKTFMDTEIFANRGLGALLPGINFIVGMLNVLIFWTCARLVPEGSLPYPLMSVVIQYAALILTGFVLMTVIIVQLPRALVCANRVNEVIYTEQSVKSNKVTPKTTEEGTIEFRNVTFKYPGSNKPAIENISFKAEKGSTIAFIGATGSGKTTLINLLPRFYDASEGEVLVDGVNVKEYNLDDLFTKFGYVPQKGYLFHDTLINNITIGKDNATAGDIERALNISQSTEFVNKLPGGLNYEISQGGKNVSGGQRQRLCIARAIIMEPEIFIFDDSFSALDYRTDKILRGEIKKECVGTTNVIVAQRVGTIMDADQIIVLDQGKMVGKGTHKELLKTCPVYKEIALSQLSKEELENA